MVSLSSCLFTIASAFAFSSGPMAWDASRISAAIPSGVGFLGAGLIFKDAEKDELSGQSTHVVHGPTTATSVWLSAAVGVACGGALYFVSVFATCIMLVLLRFGPRQRFIDEEEPKFNQMPPYHAVAGSDPSPTNENDADKETTPFLPTGVDPRSSFTRKSDARITASVRSRAALGSLM